MPGIPLPLLVLATVLVTIAAGGVGPLRVPMWLAMTLGALAVVATGSIGPARAWEAVDWNVLGFLLGAFLIGHALEESGVLGRAAHRLFRTAGTPDAVVARLLIGSALTSGLLMNDTLAIVGTPVALALARRHALDPRLTLLTLAFGVTLGSAASPIGNPQNLLIALHGGLADPFRVFGRHLLMPSAVNLAAAFAVLRLAFRRQFRRRRPMRAAPADAGAPNGPPAPPPARPGGGPALAALALLLALVLVRAVLEVSAPAAAPPLSAVALLAAVALLVFSPRRLQLLRGLDWRTLAFFAALFVLVRSAWDTGVIQSGLTRLSLDPTGVSAVLGVSTLVSQLISNVPLVALYLPVLQAHGAGPLSLMALAAGSTVAGNLLLVGAASNIIIVQTAERRGRVRLSFVDFARVGIPLTVLNVLVYALSLHWGAGI